ncbi:MAG: hypothetical protein JWO53_63, partial [Chlamydiia bacterium]|nr:hypothetical protein [Chlamydiia bacterium]
MRKLIEFAVVVPAYNNSTWVSKNLCSIAEQTYPYFHLYYIDDASTDGAVALAGLFLKNSKLRGKNTFIRNKDRVGSLANFYMTIAKIEPHKIIVCVDGDDWLTHPKALERLANEYENEKIWMTYGSFETEPFVASPSKLIPDSIYKERGFRSYSFVSSHLKTFYAKLFQLIKKEDFLFEGNFFPMAGDMAFMFPMLEMASQQHVKMVDE